ncbi:MAG: NAD(P)H-quinone oxidoreductase subunit M [Waterburya sp.]
MLVKSTTRHVRLYSAEVKGNELIPSDRVLTLDVDPDNEFSWDEDTLQKVYHQFDELVEANNGEDLSEYNLRRIGSDLEHFIRSLLLKGEISYNLNARVRNYSMGLPRMESPDTEGKYL